MDLFSDDAEPPKTAIISRCGKFRYRLTRTWDQQKRPACFIMLNPSTADAEKDDPTIRRCLAFAKAWGSGGIVVVNLFAFRSSKPSDMMAADDPVGPENDRYIREAVTACSPVVAAWGAKGNYRCRGQAIKRLVTSAGVAMTCLRLTDDGHPWHPLYMPADAVPIPFADQLEGLR